jgi:hypothetical protein
MICAAAIDAALLFVAAFGAWSGSELNLEKHRTQESISGQYTAKYTKDKTPPATFREKEPESTPVNCQPCKKENKNEDSGPIRWTDIAIACSSVITGAFTIALGISTIFLWRETRDLAKLGREEFVATHRPKLIVRDVSAGGGSDQILYMLVNIGGSKATIVESWIHIEFWTDNIPIRNMRSHGHNDLGNLVIRPGDFADLTFSVPVEFSSYLLFGKNALRLEDIGRRQAGNCYFAGTVVYADDLGNRRRMVFRRRWDEVRGGFYPTGDPEHEYSD